MKSDTIESISRDLLNACAQAYTEVDGAPAVPQRRFVTHGQAVASGEQLTVACAAVRLGGPFPFTKQSAVKTVAIPQADLLVEVWRDVWPLPHVSSPSKSLPDPADITEAAVLLGRDASTLFAYISMLAARGVLFPSIPEIGTSEYAALSPMIPLGPVDRLAGWRWPISVKLAIL